MKEHDYVLLLEKLKEKQRLGVYLGLSYREVGDQNLSAKGEKTERGKDGEGLFLV